MNTSFKIDFDNTSIDNNMWPKFVEHIGIHKAKIAIRQSLDLQDMQGNNLTLPILIVETCGSALISITTLREFTGISQYGRGNILLYSSKLKSLQLLIGS